MVISEPFLCALGVAVGTAFTGTRLRPRYAGLPSTSSCGTGLAQLAPAARRTGASLIRPSLRKLSAGRLRLAEPTALTDSKLNSTDSGGA